MIKFENNGKHWVLLVGLLSDAPPSMTRFVQDANAADVIALLKADDALQGQVIDAFGQFLRLELEAWRDWVRTQHGATAGHDDNDMRALIDKDVERLSDILRAKDEDVRELSRGLSETERQRLATVGRVEDLEEGVRLFLSQKHSPAEEDRNGSVSWRFGAKSIDELRKLVEQKPHIHAGFKDPMDDDDNVPDTRQRIENPLETAYGGPIPAPRPDRPILVSELVGALRKIWDEEGTRFDRLAEELEGYLKRPRVSSSVDGDRRKR